jgi:hypothetical protein
MERGVSKTNLLTAVTLWSLAGGALGCGAGLYDGDGSAEVTKSIDINGGVITLGQATMTINSNCVAVTSAITLRRFQSINQTGACSPVFQIEVPTSDTFTCDPTLEIMLSPNVDPTKKNLRLGFLLPTDLAQEQWVPLTSMPVSNPSRVSDRIQTLNFSNNGRTAVDYAVVIQCSSNADCPPLQGCSSNACQGCNLNGPCNPAAP